MLYKQTMQLKQIIEMRSPLLQSSGQRSCKRLMRFDSDRGMDSPAALDGGQNRSDPSRTDGRSDKRSALGYAMRSVIISPYWHLITLVILHLNPCQVITRQWCEAEWQVAILARSQIITLLD